MAGWLAETGENMWLVDRDCKEQVAGWQRLESNKCHSTTRQQVTFYNTDNKWHSTTCATSDTLQQMQQVTFYNTCNNCWFSQVCD